MCFKQQMDKMDDTDKHITFMKEAKVLIDSSRSPTFKNVQSSIRQEHISACNENFKTFLDNQLSALREWKLTLLRDTAVFDSFIGLCCNELEQEELDLGLHFLGCLLQRLPNSDKDEFVRVLFARLYHRLPTTDASTAEPELGIILQYLGCLSVALSSFQNTEELESYARQIQPLPEVCLKRLRPSLHLLYRLSVLLLKDKSYLPSTSKDATAFTISLLKSLAAVKKVSLESIAQMTQIGCLINTLWERVSLNDILETLCAIYAILCSPDQKNQVSASLAHILTLIPDQVVQTLTPRVIHIPQFREPINFETIMLHLSRWLVNWPTAQPSVLFWLKTLTKVIIENRMYDVIYVVINSIARLWNAAASVKIIHRSIIEALAVLYLSLQSHDPEIIAEKGVASHLLFYCEKFKEVNCDEKDQELFSEVAWAFHSLLPQHCDASHKLKAALIKNNWPEVKPERKKELLAEYLQLDSQHRTIESRSFLDRRVMVSVSHDGSYTSTYHKPEVTSLVENYIPLQTELPDSEVVARTALPAGLANIGSTCYFNSIMQALFATDAFRRSILFHPFNISAKLSELQVLYCILSFTTENYITPPKNMVKIIVPEDFEIGTQQDASELLGHLLDKLKDSEKHYFESNSHLLGNNKHSKTQTEFYNKVYSTAEVLDSEPILSSTTITTCNNASAIISVAAGPSPCKHADDDLMPHVNSINDVTSKIRPLIPHQNDNFVRTIPVTDVAAKRERQSSPEELRHLLAKFSSKPIEGDGDQSTAANYSSSSSEDFSVVLPPPDDTAAPATAEPQGRCTEACEVVDGGLASGNSVESSEKSTLRSVIDEEKDDSFPDLEATQFNELQKVIYDSILTASQSSIDLDESLLDSEMQAVLLSSSQNDEPQQSAPQTPMEVSAFEFKSDEDKRRVLKRKGDPIGEDEPSKSPRNEDEPSKSPRNEDKISPSSIIECTTTDNLPGERVSDDNSDSGISTQDETGNSHVDSQSTADIATEEEDMEEDESVDRSASTTDQRSTDASKTWLSHSSITNESKDSAHIEDVALASELPPHPSVSFVEKLFGGKTVQLFHCLKCDSMRDTVDNFIDLKVSFENGTQRNSPPVTIDYLIRNTLKTQELVGSEQYDCAVCEGKQDARIHTAIIKPPEFLIVSQNRFKYDQSKIMSRVCIEENLEVPVWKLDELKAHIVSVSNMRRDQTTLSSNDEGSVPHVAQIDDEGIQQSSVSSESLPVAPPTAADDEDMIVDDLRDDYEVMPAATVGVDSVAISNSNNEDSHCSPAEDSKTTSSVTNGDSYTPPPSPKNPGGSRRIISSGRSESCMEPIFVEVNTERNSHPDLQASDLFAESMTKPPSYDNGKSSDVNNRELKLNKDTDENSYKTVWDYDLHSKLYECSIDNTNNKYFAPYECMNILPEDRGRLFYSNAPQNSPTDLFEPCSATVPDLNSFSRSFPLESTLNYSSHATASSLGSTTADSTSDHCSQSAVNNHTTTSGNLSSTLTSMSDQIMPSSNVKYVLYAIVVHSGVTSRAGHYYSYIRSSSGAVAAAKLNGASGCRPSQSWICANDESVTNIDLPTIRTYLTESPAHTATPYLMFYQRVKTDALMAPSMEKLSDLPSHLQDVVRAHLHQLRNKPAPPHVPLRFPRPPGGGGGGGGGCGDGDINRQSHGSNYVF